MATVADRFWAKVDRSNSAGCWEWTAGRHRDGYGTFQKDGKNRKAHRVAWELLRGPIPEGLCVCHSCDNPPCVRPDHLFLGTVKENAEDSSRKGRRRSSRNAGVDNPRSKLTDGDVREIRRLVAGGVNQQKVADRFGIKQPAVSEIVARKSWAHVQ